MAYTVPFEVAGTSFDEALTTLHTCLRFGIVPLLETVVDMLEELGNPDACFRSVQIAGTNGKTSTARYTAQILAGEGLKVGLYTSPELIDYNERIEVDGRPVSKETFAHGIACARLAGERVNARREALGERPYDVTEFDTLTVAACVIYAEAGIDVAVLEVGMGGRWDATSAVSSIEAVAVTGIGLDHMRILGDTLEEIASEKAAVIQAGRTCVLGVGTATPHSVEDVFLEQARTTGVPCTLVRPAKHHDSEGLEEKHHAREHAAEEIRRYPGFPVCHYRCDHTPIKLGDPLMLTVKTERGHYRELGCLKPTYQAQNIACAIALAENFLGRALQRDALFESVVACPTPGRFDLVRSKPLGLVDACHNPQSVETLIGTLEQIAPDKDGLPTLLLAVFADKDVAGMVDLLAGVFSDVVVTKTNNARCMDEHDLAQLFTDHGCASVACYPTVEEALEALRDTPFVGCGSITLAGEVAAHYRR